MKNSNFKIYLYTGQHFSQCILPVLALNDYRLDQQPAAPQSWKWRQLVALLWIQLKSICSSANCCWHISSKAFHFVPS